MITAAGNILVIASFYFYRNLRTINNYLILNLAIADLIIGVYSMNVYTVYVTQGQYFTEVKKIYVSSIIQQIIEDTRRP